MTDARIRHAVIVAAGRSTRLRALIGDLPKPLVSVDGRTPILIRSVEALRARGVERITVVVGYHHEQISARLATAAECLLNPFFAHCDNLGSLWFARSAVRDRDFLYLHGDLIYDAELIDDVITPTSEPTISLVVDPGTADEEAMKIRVDGEREVHLGKRLLLREAAGEWIGLAAISGGASEPLFRAVDALMRHGALDDYDVSAFNLLRRGGVRFRIVWVGSRAWREIDDERDFRAAQALFAPEAVASRS